MDARIPTKKDALVHEVSETGDVVVFDEAGNQLLLLNEIGAAVWLLLDGQRSVRGIADLIVETLPADPDQVERDVAAFLQTLEAHGMVALTCPA